MHRPLRNRSKSRENSPELAICAQEAGVVESGNARLRLAEGANRLKETYERQSSANGRGSGEGHFSEN